MRKKAMYAFIFDSGRFDTCWYGMKAFESIHSCKELRKIWSTIIFYHGDLTDFGHSTIDIEPLIEKDDECTIDLNLCSNFKDWPYCVVLDGLSKLLAKKLDSHIRGINPSAYVGMSKININTNDPRKQIWRHLVKSYKTRRKTIFAYENPKETGSFAYKEIAQKLGWKIKYSKEYLRADFYDYENLSSTKIPKEDSLDRNILSMNFALGQELQNAGALIWKSIEDIDCTNIFEDLSGNISSELNEYCFLALYHASQGIERIQKIIIQLICKKDHIKGSEKSKSLELMYNHNICALNDWILNHTKSKLTVGNELLNILDLFYNKVRYNRYLDNPSMDIEYEKHLLLRFGLNTYKKKFGSQITITAKEYFREIEKLAHELNIYVYEIESSSYAFNVFYSQTNNLYEEYNRVKIAKKEILYSLMYDKKMKTKYSILKFTPLNLDAESIDSYIQYLVSSSSVNSYVFDEIDSLYDDLCQKDKTNWKNRVDIMESYFGESNGI